MSSKEKNLIVQSRPAKGAKIGLGDVPWRAILTCFPLLAKAFVWFAMSYMIYNATNNMPTYLKRVHGLKISEISNIFGLVSVVTMIVNLVVACAADRMRHVMTTTGVRKLFAGSLTIIFIPASLYIIGLGCDTWTIIICVAVYIMFASSVSSMYFKYFNKCLFIQF